MFDATGEEYKPNCLVADAAGAITRGFQRAFSYQSFHDYSRVVCWQHVKRASFQRLVSVTSVTKNSDCKSYFRKLEVGFVDFDSYKSSIGSLHYVDFIKENWLKSQCSCQHWMKNYFCHHVVYIAFKFNLVEFLDIHRAIPIGKSRSRGRPKTIIANSRKASSSESEVSTSDSEKIEKAAKKQVNKKIVKKKTGPKPKQKNN